MAKVKPEVTMQEKKAQASKIRTHPDSEINATDRAFCISLNQGDFAKLPEAKAKASIARGIKSIIANGGRSCTGKQLDAVAKAAGKNERMLGRNYMRAFKLHPQGRASNHVVDLVQLKAHAKTFGVELPNDLSEIMKATRAVIAEAKA